MEQSPLPSPDDLQAFLRIAQEASFSRAAAALGVPKATLSRRVAQLERDLGVALLVRTTRSVQVTEAGRAFLPEAAAVLAALEDAAARVREEGGVPRGRLRIAAPVEYGATVLSPLLAGFAGAHPAVELAVELTRRTVDLAYEGFDLAVRLGPLADPALATRRLGTLRQGLYASPAYLARHGRPRYAHELAEHPALQQVGADGALPAHRRRCQRGARPVRTHQVLHASEHRAHDGRRRPHADPQGPAQDRRGAFQGSDRPHVPGGRRRALVAGRIRTASSGSNRPGRSPRCPRCCAPR